MEGRITRVAATLGALVFSALTSCGDAASTRPSVLLITIDTLRADYLGTYGFPLDTSPSIDRLADESVVFDRAIAASSTTSPSHASIMTSRYTREHSIGFESGSTKLVGGTTLAEAFQNEGYATAAFVGNVNLRSRLGFDRGFDQFDDELTDREVNRPFMFERTAEQTTERALTWLAWLRDARSPWFLWVHYQDPHGPYTPPEPYIGRFRIPPEPDEKPLPVLSRDGPNGIPHYQAIEGLDRPSQYRGRYADEIHYADVSIAALLAAVDARDRETVILLTADHGESMGEDGAYFMHPMATTPQLAHVPTILRAPGLAPGRRSETVSHVDIAPTLLELAGLSALPDSSGIALGPILRGDREMPDRFVYCDSGEEVGAYRGDFLVRVTGLLPAWSGGSRLAPIWGAYTWRNGAQWKQTNDTGAAEARLGTHADALVAYFSSARPMQAADPPDADDLERLKILGYVDAEGAR